MRIHPEVIVTPDCPTVMFREPREKVDLKVEIPKILASQGWGLGTYFDIQFINHDRTELLATGKFIVTKDSEALHTANPEGYQPITKTISARKAGQIGDWYYPGDLCDLVGKKVDVVADGSLREAIFRPQFEKVLKWNPGKKVHQVLLGDKVLYESKNKSEAEEYRDAA